MTKKIEKLEDLTPDEHNANRGTQRGVSLLEKSLEHYGAGRSVLVDKNGKIIAGNKTVQSAVEKGFEAVVVKTDGRKLVVVQRDDLDMDKDVAARELAIADNRVAEVDLDWDGAAIADLMGDGVKVDGFFTEEEINRIVSAQELPAPQDGDASGFSGSSEGLWSRSPYVRIPVTQAKANDMAFKTALAKFCADHGLEFSIKNMG